MRLFVAVELDEAVQRAAEQAAEELRERIGRWLNAKWVSPANMHLTVRFIGHVPDERVRAILEALRPPLAIDASEVSLSNCGAFPSHGPPRVLWVGLREGLLSLQAMHEEFNRRLLCLGFESEDRPFNAHLTLARVKDAPRGSGRATRDAIQSVRVTPASCRIIEATVFESRLAPTGSTYIPRLRIPVRP